MVVTLAREFQILFLESPEVHASIMPLFANPGPPP